MQKEEALQAMRGVALVAALSVLVEVGDFHQHRAANGTDGRTEGGRAQQIQWCAVPETGPS
jgi:hypothetical protein